MAPIVALAGFMGSGKSSVGPKVAALLGWRFVDMDDAFVEVEHTPIAAFFSAKGEAAFRARECELLGQVLSEASQGGGLVVALGGGTLQSAPARDLLAGRAGVVYLEVDSPTAWSRVAGTGRPLAVDMETFRALLERRRVIYETASDWVVPVEQRGIDDLAREIADIVRAGGDRWPTLWGRRLRSTQRSSLVMGGAGCLAALGFWAEALGANGARPFVITDRNVMEVWGARIVSLLGPGTAERVLAIEPGEASKSVTSLERCWEWLAGQSARRDDVIVALGGGVVGDLAGFVAATYQRGVSLWQVPTTLLAQVDSSIGGKTAVDLAAGKNLVGAFYQADLVFTDPETLTTLQEEDYIGGLAEVVKHTLLMPVGALERLEAAAGRIMTRDPETLSQVVRQSIDFKAAVVQEDEREQGKRAILNLGHTVGHAIELARGYGSISHGNAVALGLLVALALSEKLAGLDMGIRPRTRSLLDRFGLMTSLRVTDIDQLVAATGRDKKARAGTSGFVLLKAPGTPVWGVDVPRGRLAEALEVIRE